MLATTNVGLVVAVIEYLKSRPTPVAKNVEYNNTDYAALDMDELVDVANLAGGSVEVYDSKDDYEKQKSAQSKFISTTSEFDIAIPAFEPISQTIQVLDYVSNEPMSNILVALNGVPRFTSVYGTITTTIDTEYVELVVQPQDNDEYVPHIEYMHVTGGTYTVKLKKSTDDISIFAAVMSYDGDNINLVTQEYTIDQNSPASSDTAIIRVSTNLPQADKYYIKQHGNIIKESYTQDIVVDMKKDFAVGGSVTIGIEYEGLTKEVDTYLSFVFIDSLNLSEMIGLNEQKDEPTDIGDEILGKWEWTIIASISAMIDIGKSDFSIGKGLSIEHDNRTHTLKILYGIKLNYSPDWINKDKVKLCDSFKDAYKANRKKGISVIESLKKNFGDLNAKKSNITGSNKSFSFEFELELNGFVDIDSRTGKLVEIGFDFSLDASFTFGFQFYVFFIPAYLSITLGVNLELEIAFNKAKETILTFIITAYLKLGLGVGIQGIAGINAYGQANFEWTITNSSDGNSFKIDLVFGIEGTIAFWNFDVPFGNIHLHNQPLPINNKTKLYEISSISNNKESNTLVLNKKPKIVSLGDKKIMTWVDESSGRDEYNDSVLYYSVFENNKWGQVRFVDSDGTGDFLPSLYSDGEAAYVAWQDLSKVMNENNTLDDMLSSSEIVVSKFDTATNTFEAPVKITSNNTLQTMPKFAKSLDSKNSSTSLVWMTNSENDPFGQTGINSLMSSTLQNGAWSKPTLVYKTEKPIISFDAMYNNSSVELAINIDSDNDLLTVDDRDIILYNVSEKSQISVGNDDVINSNPQFSIQDGKMSLFFYSDGNIVYVDDFSTNTINNVTQNPQMQASGDNFVTTSDGKNTAILYPQNNNDGIDDESSDDVVPNVLLGLVYDAQNQIWNNNIEIDTVDDKIQAFASEFDGNTISYTYFNNTITQSTQIDFDTYSIGNSVEINDAYMIDTLQYDAKNDIFVNLQNNGAYSIDKVDFKIFDKIYPIALDESLNTGTSTIIKLSAYVPNIETNSIELSVTLDGVYYSTYSLLVYTSQVTMSIDKYIENGIERFVLTLNNIGQLDDTVQLYIKEFDSDGRLLYKSIKIDITKGETKTLNIELDYTQLELFEPNILYFELVTSNSQMYNEYSKQSINGVEKIDNSKFLSYLHLNNLLNQAREVSL